jgi:hypothetical protein
LLDVVPVLNGQIILEAEDFEADIRTREVVLRVGEYVVAILEGTMLTRGEVFDSRSNSAARADIVVVRPAGSIEALWSCLMKQQAISLLPSVFVVVNCFTGVMLTGRTGAQPFFRLSCTNSLNNVVDPTIGLVMSQFETGNVFSNLSYVCIRRSNTIVHPIDGHDLRIGKQGAITPPQSASCCHLFCTPVTRFEAFGSPQLVFGRLK